jgi:carboxyl-terminal processing protease
MKKRISLSVVVALMAVSLLAGFGINHLISGDPLYDQVNKFRDVLSLTEKYYIEEVDTPKLTEAALTGLLDKLDPHSVYIPAAAFTQVREDFRGKFEGIGIAFRILNDTILVMETIGGGPAARMGILSNDRIVKINDSSAIGYSNTEVMSRLKGPKGTKVKVTIKRPHVDELLDFVIVRDEILQNSVEVAMMVTEDIGYVNVNRFSERTHLEMEQALAKLKKEGMKRLILDLRSNPGGILEEAFKMADMFLDGGTKEQPRKIVYTKARRSEFDEAFFARTGQAYESLPLIILISNYSASASEIVAGAIQDWDRGLVVGETSFGKGLVQRQWPLADGSALRLTIAKYYTPSGRLIQRDYAGKEKEEYQREAFQRQEQEGENLDHKVEGDSSRPAFRTYGGRIVYGGGGITPDYVVKNPALTNLTQTISRRGLLEQFVISYLDAEGAKIRATFGKDFKLYRDSFVISDALIRDFRNSLQKNDVKIDEEEFKKDLDYIKVRLKATIARSFWGSDGWYPIMLTVDHQFQKALGLFPEAEKIAKLN